MSKCITLFSKDKKYRCSVLLSDSSDNYGYPDNSSIYLFEKRGDGDFLIATSMDTMLETEKDLLIAELKQEINNLNYKENMEIWEGKLALKNEIKELKRQLSKAIVPKFDYLQPVWCVYPDNKYRKGFVFEEDFVGYTKDKLICNSYNNEEFELDMVFPTQAEAQAKLDEIRRK